MSIGHSEMELILFSRPLTCTHLSIYVPRLTASIYDLCCILFSLSYRSLELASEELLSIFRERLSPPWLEHRHWSCTAQAMSLCAVWVLVLPHLAIHECMVAMLCTHSRSLEVDHFRACLHLLSGFHVCLDSHSTIRDSVGDRISNIYKDGTLIEQLLMLMRDWWKDGHRDLSDHFLGLGEWYCQAQQDIWRHRQSQTWILLKEFPDWRHVGFDQRTKYAVDKVQHIRA